MIESNEEHVIKIKIQDTLYKSSAPRYSGILSGVRNEIFGNKANLYSAVKEDVAH